ncbi:MAG: vitamin K epoxide reductase family protein [Nanoarchaeota archaeon]|nr:vitamin K epoxide reductase family protein [Nanoarchaeota archaeon]MDP3758654.1 vitamin K epoxide reductase family protein [Candidatus Daviesbacteria bacterium]
MQPEFIASLIVLAILGIFDSGYLLKKRVKKQPLSCPIDGNCEKVVESKWNKIFFIKNDFLGLFYYILILFLALYLFFASEKLLFLTQIISGASLLFSLVLVFIQAKIIKEYCFYCLISALINLLIFANVFFID